PAERDGGVARVHLMIRDVHGRDAVLAEQARGGLRGRACHQRMHLAAAGQPAGEREGLQRHLLRRAVLVLDVDERHATSPARRSTSTTAGAAAGPCPRISAWLVSPSGSFSRIFSTPGAVRFGLRVSSGFRLARRRPGTDGYRGRFSPSFTVTTAGNATS